MLTMLFHWVPLKTVQGVKRNNCLSTTRPFEDVVLGDLLDLEGASHSVFFSQLFHFFKLCVLGMQVDTAGLGDRRHWNPGTRVSSGCEPPDPDAGD